jgi:phospholipase/carboxylesterase
VNDAPIQIDTGFAPTFALIWLHGLGADGSDFVPVIPELGLPPELPGRFIFPHAPYMPVTCNGGYEMRAWYDILSLAPGSREVDEASLQRSRETVRQLIGEQLAAGIPSRRIFLAGFSQGGAVAYTTALTQVEPLGGLIALSTYLPAPELVCRELSPANRELPVFAAHGSEDGVVAPALGLQAQDWLEQWGLAPEWHVYPMEHSVCLEEVADIGAWLARRLAA